VLVHIRPVCVWFVHSLGPPRGIGLMAGSVPDHRADGEPAKCPESLCLMLALPPSGRRVPAPPRTLLLGLRSYRLMRQSRVALPYFGLWPRSWSLRRLLPAPAATGILPTLSLRILPQMPSPVPRQVPQSAFTCFLLCVIGLPQMEIGSASCFVPRTRFFAGVISRLQTFRYV
jgi:hypothetical protein